jgi:hypothetical protein
MKSLKPSKLIAYLVGIVLLGLGGVAAITNPDPKTYEEFAARQLSQYLKENTCAKAGLALQSSCGSLIEDNQAQIQQLISTNTERQNFLLLSIYKTDLSPGELLPDFLSNLLPSYHFETVGAFSHFQVYKIKKQ